MSNIAFSESDHSTEESSHEGSALVVCFTFAGLLAGAILREINKKFRIPYTPMLLAVGIVAGSQISKLGVLGDSIQTMLQIDPEGILMVFIPTLIFESGFNADWYIFKRAIINILVLAGPGVLVTAVSLGTFLKVILGYSDDDLTWPAAMTLGSILAATDPVAVVALLKELGASSKFNLLIEGESLLNDGTAMVFFAVFLDMAKGLTSNFGSVIENFVQLAIGGPIFGFFVGIIGSLWLKRITRDGVLSISLTVIACYLMFFVAETYLKVSGILALVTLGLFMSATGKTKIDHETGHFMHTVWAWLQYSCETLIFLITGILIGFHIIFNPNTTIVTSDWIKLIFFYLGMIAVRAGMVFIFLPIIRRHGYGLTNEEFIVLVWGGLRGALGLALALIVGVDDTLPNRMRDLVIFYMAGMATFTLILNGTTCAYIVKRLGMVKEPAIKKKLQQNLLAEMIAESTHRIEELQSNRFLNVCDWKAVEKIIGLEELHHTLTETYGKSQELKEIANKNRRESVYQTFADDDIYQEARYRFLRIMKGIFWEKYEEAQIRGDTVKLLVESVNTSMDRIQEPINMWGFLYVYFTSFKSIRFIIKIKDFFLVGRLVKKYIANHMAFIYEVVTAFIQACDEVIACEQKLPMSKVHIKVIIDEFEKNKMDATSYIVSLEETFAELIKAIQIQRASNSVLEHQKAFIQEMLNTGQIEDNEYNILRRQIDRRIISLDSLKIDWIAPTFNNFMMEFPFFSGLGREEINAIVKKAEPKKFHKGDILFEKGQAIGSLFIITRGVVRETYDGKKNFERGIGSMMNLANIMTDRNLAISTGTCFSEVDTYAIPLMTIDFVMQKKKDFEDKVYKQALISFIQAESDLYREKILLEEAKLAEAARKGEVEKLQEGEKVTLENGGYIFSGEIKRGLNADTLNRDITYGKLSLVPPSNYEFVATMSTTLISFDEDVKDLFLVRKASLRKESRVDFRKLSLHDKNYFMEDSFQTEFNKNLKSKENDHFLK